VEVCNQITLPILYYISSTLVTFLQMIDAPVQVSDIFYLTVSFKCINFRFQIFLPFFSELSVVLHCLDFLHCFGLDPLTAAV
jgi:hypothetical protein